MNTVFQIGADKKSAFGVVGMGQESVKDAREHIGRNQPLVLVGFQVPRRNKTNTEPVCNDEGQQILDFIPLVIRTENKFHRQKK